MTSETEATPRYPEHEKLAAVKAKSQTIGEFLDHMPYTLAEWRDDLITEVECSWDCTPDDPDPDHESCDGTGWRTVPAKEQFVPVRLSVQEVLAEYFGIDLDRVEEEKRAMLDEIRAAQA